MTIEFLSTQSEIEQLCHHWDETNSLVPFLHPNWSRLRVMSGLGAESGLCFAAMRYGNGAGVFALPIYKRWSLRASAKPPFNWVIRDGIVPFWGPMRSSHSGSELFAMNFTAMLAHSNEWKSLDIYDVDPTVLQNQQLKECLIAKELKLRETLDRTVYRFDLRDNAIGLGKSVTVDAIDQKAEVENRGLSTCNEFIEIDWVLNKSKLNRLLDVATKLDLWTSPAGPPELDVNRLPSRDGLKWLWDRRQLIGATLMVGRQCIGSILGLRTGNLIMICTIRLIEPIRYDTPFSSQFECAPNEVISMPKVPFSKSDLADSIIEAASLMGAKQVLFMDGSLVPARLHDSHRVSLYRWTITKSRIGTLAKGWWQKGIGYLKTMKERP